MLKHILWDIYALTYDSGTGMLEIYDELLHHVIKKADIKAEDVIVDIGCGTGNLEKEILRKNIRFGKITGLDISQSMLTRAAKKIASPNIEYLQFDANQRFPFRDKSVDKVIMIHSLYTLQSPNKVLHEVRRILKDSGSLVIANPYDVDGKDKIKRAAFSGLSMRRKLFLFITKVPVIIINSIIAKQASEQNFHFLSQSEMTKLLHECGFRIPEKMDKVYADTSLLFVTNKSR